MDKKNKKIDKRVLGEITHGISGVPVDPIIIEEVTKFQTEVYNSSSLETPKGHVLSIKYILIIFIACLIMGVSVLFFFRDALPGNRTYFIKIFSEKILGVTYVKAESRCLREVELADLRLTEGEVLILEKKLDSQAQGVIQYLLKKHAQKVKEKSLSLAQKGDVYNTIDILGTFESLLRAHETVLTALQRKNRDAEPLLLTVREEIVSVRSERVRLEDQVKVTVEDESVLVEGVLKNVENKILEVESVLNRRIPFLEKKVVTQVEAEIENAKRLLMEGEVGVSLKSYHDSYFSFQQSIKKTDEIILALQIQERINTPLDLWNHESDTKKILCLKDIFLR